MALLLFPILSVAENSAAVGAIRTTLERQVADWNRGDIQAFVSVYTEDSVFVGSAVSKGRSQVLDRYLKRYPNREAMGKTTFSDLDIRLLDAKHATVVGRWKLERSQAAGGATGGIFSLVLEKVKNEWKIVLDHTS